MSKAANLQCLASKRSQSDSHLFYHYVIVWGIIAHYRQYLFLISKFIHLMSQQLLTLSLIPKSSRILINSVASWAPVCHHPTSTASACIKSRKKERAMLNSYTSRLNSNLWTLPPSNESACNLSGLLSSFKFNLASQLTECEAMSLKSTTQMHHINNSSTTTCHTQHKDLGNLASLGSTSNATSSSFMTGSLMGISIAKCNEDKDFKDLDDAMMWDSDTSDNTPMIVGALWRMAAEYDDNNDAASIPAVETQQPVRSMPPAVKRQQLVNLHHSQSSCRWHWVSCEWYCLIPKGCWILSDYTSDIAQILYI